MDQKINSSLELHVSKMLQQIINLSNYSEVETAIASIVDPEKECSIPRHLVLKALETKIEHLSPLLFNSTQWSCLRYALICLRSISI